MLVVQNESYTRDVKNVMHILYIVYSKLTKIAYSSVLVWEILAVQCWNFWTIYGGQEPSRNRVLQATWASGIDSLESISGLHRSLKIPPQFTWRLHGLWCHPERQRGAAPADLLKLRWIGTQGVHTAGFPSWLISLRLKVSFDHCLLVW